MSSSFVDPLEWTTHPLEVVLFVETIVFHGTIIGTSLLLMPCLLYFRNKQPVKSRKMVPFLFLAAATFTHAFYLSFYISRKVRFIPEFTIDLLNNIANSILSVVMITLASVYFVQCLRYFFVAKKLGALQVKYVDVMIKQEQAETVQPQAKLHASLYKMLMSSKLIWITMLINFLTSSFVFGLLLILFGAGIIRDPSYPIQGIAYSVIVIYAILCVGLFLYDLIIHKGFQQCFTCKCKTYLILDDNLLFRIDFIIITFAVLLGIVDMVALFIPQKVRGFLIFLVLIKLACWLSMIISVGGGLVVATALVERIMLHTGMLSSSFYVGNDASNSGNNSNSYENTGLYNCLRDNEGYKLFEHFCNSEQSTENLYCWTMIQKLKSYPPNDGNRRVLAQYIFDMFIQIGSMMEINITHRARSPVAASLKEQCFDPTPDSVFRDVEAQVDANLYDTFQRFETTQVYRTYKKGYDVRKHMLSKHDLLVQNTPNLSIVNSDPNSIPNTPLIAPPTPAFGVRKNSNATNSSTNGTPSLMTPVSSTPPVLPFATPTYTVVLPSTPTTTTNSAPSSPSMSLILQ